MGATFVGALLVAAFAPSTQALAALALLEPTVPSVHVRQAGRPFSLATESVALQAGDAIRTDATGRALVTYADGTTLGLEPKSELVIESLQRNGQDLFVLVNQTAGRVWYQLSRGLSPTARYTVRSGALAAVVRAGSTVEVAVSDEGASITALEGSVEATAGGTTVTVAEGTSALISTDDAASTAPTPTPSSAPSYAPVAIKLAPIPVATQTAPASAAPALPSASPAERRQTNSTAVPRVGTPAVPTPPTSGGTFPSASPRPTTPSTATPAPLTSVTPASTPKPRNPDPQPDRGRDDEQRSRRLGDQSPSP